MINLSMLISLAAQDNSARFSRGSDSDMEEGKGAGFGFRSISDTHKPHWFQLRIGKGLPNGCAGHRAVPVRTAFMFWRLSERREFMDSEHTQTSPCLIVNRVEIITEGCSACGQTFASEPTGDKTLVA